MCLRRFTYGTLGSLPYIAFCALITALMALDFLRFAYGAFGALLTAPSPIFYCVSQAILEPTAKFQLNSSETVQMQMWHGAYGAFGALLTASSPTLLLCVPCGLLAIRKISSE